jgi:hypothetical protein
LIEKIREIAKSNTELGTLAVTFVMYEKVIEDEESEKI